MIINPTGRKIIRLVFFMASSFSSLSLSLIFRQTHRFPAGAPDFYKTTVHLFVLFFLLSLYILLPKKPCGNVFEDQYHKNRAIQKKTHFRSFLSFYGIKADIFESIGKKNGKIEPVRLIRDYTRNSLFFSILTYLGEIRA